MDQETRPCCFHCGNPCSGDVTETVVIYDDITAEKPICDEPDECPANIQPDFVVNSAVLKGL